MSGYGNGSVRPYATTSGKRWSITYWYTDRAGQRRQRKQSGFTSEAKAKKALRDALYQRDNGLLIERSTFTVRDVCEQKYLPWCADRVEAGRIQPISLRNYRQNLSRYVYPTIGDVRVQDLTREHVQALIDGMAHLSPYTTSMVVTVLAAALDLAVDDGLLMVNPAKSKRVEKPVKSSQAPDNKVPWSAEEARHFLATLDTNGDPVELGIYVMALTGIRVAEAVGLRWGDFDPEKGVLRVQRSVTHVDGERYVNDGGKTRNARRMVGLRPNLIAILAAHKTREAARFWSSGQQFSDDSPIFATWLCEPFAPKTFSARFRRCVKRTGLRHIALHTLRHGYVTHAQTVEGVSAEMVKKAVGHGSLAMTAHYTHADEQAIQSVAAAVAERLLGETG